MTGADDDFDDFLRRRKPVFRRDDDDLEPPAELDRIVLRQAREAIEADKPQRVFRGPRWGAPIALAATVLVALSVVFHGGMPATSPVGEVAVQSISREVATPADEPAESRGATGTTADPPVAPPRERVADNGAVIVDLAPREKAETPTIRERSARALEPESASVAPPPPPRGLVADAEASRYAVPLPSAPSTEAAAAPAAASRRAEAQSSAASARVDASGASLAKASPEAPAWRRDSKTWLAEIERLRAAGETALAEAEMAEYNRQQRAFAGAPDR